jgi:tetratricopeptide (TPR) repeat protein
VNRRDFLRWLSVAAANVALPPSEREPEPGLERLHVRSSRPASVDDALLAQYADVNRSLWLRFGHAARKASVLPLVHDQVRAVTRGLQEPHGTAQHQRLCALAGDLFQLAGEILFDLDRYSEAAQCYTIAADACREARSYDLWACAIVRHAFIAIYEERFEEALPLLDVAGRAARRGDPALSTRHWVSAVAADAFAGAGEVAACQRELDRAEQVHALGQSAGGGGWLRFDGSRLAEQRGSCFARLGRPDLAEPALRDAMTQGLSARRRGLVLCDLAQVALRRGEVDQACVYGESAAEIASAGASGVVRRRLLELRRRLGPYEDVRAVGRFVERIGST